MSSPGLDTPCRSISDLKRQLRGERIMAMLAQHEAETAGCDTAAAHHERAIEKLDVRLRAIDEAEAWR